MSDACHLCHCCGEKRHDGDDPCVSCDAVRQEALEAARAVYLAISTDIAQDFMEDPVGANAAEKAGYHRINATRLIELQRALLSP